ncbi:MAG: hypothetical protein HC905_29100 [Bacteroidales bacterium]|nr:hypothetical protein [Bacteroidales bacterium]
MADRRGAEECIRGVMASLNHSPRFQAVAPGDMDLRGTGTREFPPALDWYIVEDICKQNQADALITLETFDSNNSISIGERQAERKDGDRTIKFTEFLATLNVQIEAGWKIYYPAEKRIIDQNIYSDGRSWSNASDARKKAEAGLPFMDQAVADAGRYAGERYAFRISPMWVNVSRYYFRKGNADLKQLTDLVNQVTGRVQPIYGLSMWMQGIRKLQEMHAIIWPWHGNWKAIWNQLWNGHESPYTKYNNKKGRYYANILQQRIYDQSRLDEQMQNN